MTADELRAAFEALAVRLDESARKQDARADGARARALDVIESVACGKSLAYEEAAAEIRKVLNG